MDIQVRKALVQDVPALKELNYEFNNVIVPESKIIYEISKNHEIIIVAVDDDLPIGFACGQIKNTFCYNYKDGEITELYVREDYRRNGIATRMIHYLENIFKSKGCNQISLLTGNTNFNAQRLYKECGYEIKDKIVMVKYFYEKEH